VKTTTKDSYNVLLGVKIHPRDVGLGKFWLLLCHDQPSKQLGVSCFQ